MLGRFGLGSSLFSSSSRFVLGGVSLRLARPGGVDGVLSWCLSLSLVCRSVC